MPVQILALGSHEGLHPLTVPVPHSLPLILTAGLVLAAMLSAAAVPVSLFIRALVMALMQVLVKVVLLFAGAHPHIKVYPLINGPGQQRVQVVVVLFELGYKAKVLRFLACACPVAIYAPTLDHLHGQRINRIDGEVCLRCQLFHALGWRGLKGAVPDPGIVPDHVSLTVRTMVHLLRDAVAGADLAAACNLTGLLVRFSSQIGCVEFKDGHAVRGNGQMFGDGEGEHRRLRLSYLVFVTWI